MRIQLQDITRRPWFRQEHYPYTPKEIHLATGIMSYIDEGKGRPVLFIHGTPSWSFEYVPIIEQLRANFRCIAPDHLGFGLSSRPNADYSLGWHTKNFSDWVKTLALDSFDIVTHDFGSLIAFPYLSAHAQKVGKIIVLNSWLWPLETFDKSFKYKRWLAGSMLMRWLYFNLNFSPRVMVKAGWGPDQEKLKLYQPYFAKMFPVPEFRRATWAVAKLLTQQASEMSEVLQAAIVLKNKPAALIWGMKDTLVSPVHLEGWRETLSVQQEVLLDGAGHFPQLESPTEVAAAIELFLSS